MPDERTPLFATVRVGPPRRRYEHGVVRRFCTIAISSLLIAFSLAILVALAVAPREGSGGRHPHYGGDEDGWSWPGAPNRKLSYEQLKQILLETPSAERAEEWSRYYTAGPHLTGQNYSQALWTSQKWAEWGLKSEVVPYDVYINYPLDHRLALLEKGKVSFEASLTEDVLDEDATSGLADRVPTFHGYSASGNVTAPVVYVNYGSFQDFQDLQRANVSLTGKIAIARYGGLFRGLKVKRAQELGMVGVILYSDPGDDGDNTEANGADLYPEGPARQPSSVQRGSVQFLSVAPGDPTTPGYPSKPGAPRAPVEGFIPSIPSIPVSYLDALPILKALNGHGPSAKDLNQYWTRNAGLGYKGVEYSIGPTPDDVVVNLYNAQDYKITPLWDVIGVINGSIADEVVVVGNHRDAWIAGGAGDPNSGSAVINEAIRAFGRAAAAGWVPLRTIVFASWDGEEYGLLGSTEWVEEHLPWLSAANVAYVNVDTGVTGSHFKAAAAPLLDNIIRAAVAQVPSPNQTVPGQTVGDTWDGRVITMGGGSDYAAFQDYAGVPSMDVGFKEGPDDAVYHYHSNYDSFYWMQNFGDRGFVYHRAMAQVFGLIIAHIADLPVLSFRAAEYAAALEAYVSRIDERLDAALSRPEVEESDVNVHALTDEEVFSLRTRATTTRSEEDDTVTDSASPEALRRGLFRLHAAVAKLAERAAKLDHAADELSAQAAHGLPWWKWPAKLLLGFQIRGVNNRYKLLERAFLYDGGLDGRSWFKHVVFAPGLWTGYAGAVFPGLVESIDSKDWKNAERWALIIEDCIARATKGVTIH